VTPGTGRGQNWHGKRPTSVQIDSTLSLSATLAGRVPGFSTAGMGTKTYMFYLHQAGLGYRKFLDDGWRLSVVPSGCRKWGKRELGETEEAA